MTNGNKIWETESVEKSYFFILKGDAVEKKGLLWTILFLLLCSLTIGQENETYQFSLDYLYPQTNFYRFEVASKELWSDLDLLISHNDCLNAAVDSDYLKVQFLKLRTAARMLCSHEKEARNYLPDDIEYLIEVVHLIAEKSLCLAKNLHHKHPSLSNELYLLLQETKDDLEQLMIKNEEVTQC